MSKLTTLFYIAISLCSLLTLSYESNATEVYKWTDSKGVVHFSDQATDQAEKVTIKPTQTIDLSTPNTAKGEKRFSDSKTGKAPEVSYSDLNITSPANNSAFHAPEGNITISFSATPELAEGHHFKLSMDGKNVYTGTSTSATLQNIDRGTHVFAVSINDASGISLISSPPITATLHRPIATKTKVPPKN